MLNELKAILANYPEQRVDLEEDRKFTILEGDNEVEYDAEEYEDYDEWYYDYCVEKTIQLIAYTLMKKMS